MMMWLAHWWDHLMPKPVRPTCASIKVQWEDGTEEWVGLKDVKASAPPLLRETPHRSIQNITTSQRRDRVVISSVQKRDHQPLESVTAANECDSNADTCCLGKNFVILHWTWLRPLKNERQLKCELLWVKKYNKNLIKKALVAQN